MYTPFITRRRCPLSNWHSRCKPAQRAVIQPTGIETRGRLYAVFRRYWPCPVARRCLPGIRGHHQTISRTRAGYRCHDESFGDWMRHSRRRVFDGRMDGTICTRVSTMRLGNSLQASAAVQGIGLSAVAVVIVHPSQPARLMHRRREDVGGMIPNEQWMKTAFYRPRQTQCYAFHRAL